MKIDFNQSNGVLTVALDGRLDTSTAPELESFLDKQYNADDALIIDFEHLTYISSVGLRVLLATKKKAKASMKLINVCEFVMEIFEMTGFLDILEIEPWNS